MKKEYILLLLLIFPPVILIAQSVRMLTTDKELVNSLISTIYQDQKGFIWIGTENGLTRYDGTNIRTYHHEENNPSSLLNNPILSLLDDGQGNLLIGCEEGLQVYNYGTDKFTSIPINPRTHTKWEWSIRSMFQTSHKDIYLATSGGGIYLLNYRSGCYVTTPLKINYSDYNIQKVIEDKSHNIWILSDNNTITCYNKRNKTTKIIHPSRNSDQIHFLTIFTSEDGTLYAGTVASGLYCFNPQWEKFQKLPLDIKLPILNIVQYDRNHLLLATDGAGIKIVNTHTLKMSNYTLGGNSYDISHDKVHALLIDRRKNIWIGSYQKGVYLCPDHVFPFHLISLDNNLPTKSNSNYVTAICQDHKGHLWISTDNNGLYEYDSKKKLLEHYVHSEADPHSLPNAVVSLFCDHNGDVWVGSFLDELCCLKQSTHKFYRFNELTNQKHQEFYKRVFCIKEDCHHNLWLATIGNGLWSMNLDNHTIQHFFPSPTSGNNSKENSIHSAFLYSIEIDPQDKVYFSSVKGIGCYDQQKRSFTSTFGTNHIGSENPAYCLHLDKQGNIWFGGSGDLQLYKRSTHRLESYNLRSGLPDGAVCSIEEDRNNNMWVATFNGLSKFNVKTGIFENFYYDDGLQGNEYSRNGSYHDDHETLYFGGLNGVSYFNPEMITTKKRHIKIELTEMLMGEKLVTTETESNGHKVIDKPITDIDEINLNYKDASFSLSFTSFAFINPDQLTYYYSINGGKWVHLENGNNHIIFSSMQPGTYELNVKAQSNNISSNIKKIKITIAPPWYSTWWAFCIYIIILLSLIKMYLYYTKNKYNQEIKLQKIEHEEELNEAKVSFFMNISHEIRTPLTLIIDPLEKLIHTDKDTDRQKTYSLISRNSQRILQLINQLMDLRKIEKGQMRLHFRYTDLVDFLDNLYHLFEYRARQKKIRLSFIHDCDKLDVYIDPLNFDKIIMNVLSNAFKFTPQGGDISIELKHHDKIAIISITDTGVGIDNTEKEKIFGRFYQSRRSEEMYMGTGIGLNLAKDLVEMHHGSIHVENNPNHQGSVFTVCIPIGREHLSKEELLHTSEQENNFIEEESRFENRMTNVIEEPISDEEEKHNYAKTRYLILIIEDEEDILSYLQQQLSPNYRTRKATNGKEGWDMIIKTKPDLVISDVMMPIMDGIELCHLIKRNINTNHIPVILLTAKNAETSRIEGLNKGADAYIAKPFSINVLISTINNLLNTRNILKNKFNGNELQGDKVERVQMKNPDQQLMDRILAVINRELSNPDLTIEMICTEVGISRVHLNRKLKELTNQTTHDFIKNIRIKQAAQLLTTPHQNITDVAYTVGYSNIVTFINAFKDVYDISPKEYRNEITNSELTENQNT